MENSPQQQEASGLIAATVEQTICPEKEVYKCPKCGLYINILKDAIPKAGMNCPGDGLEMIRIIFRTVKALPQGLTSFREALRRGRSRNNWKRLKRVFKKHRISLDQMYTPLAYGLAMRQIRGQ